MLCYNGNKKTQHDDTAKDDLGSRTLRVTATLSMRKDGLKQDRYRGEMMTTKDIRFCPFCSVMEFDMSTAGDSVHCDLCGVDIPAEELAETV